MLYRVFSHSPAPRCPGFGGAAPTVVAASAACLATAESAPVACLAPAGRPEGPLWCAPTWSSDAIAHAELPNSSSPSPGWPRWIGAAAIRYHARATPVLAPSCSTDSPTRRAPLASASERPCAAND
jgi:hypothetical protein